MIKRNKESKKSIIRCGVIYLIFISVACCFTAYITIETYEKTFRKEYVNELIMRMESLQDRINVVIEKKTKEELRSIYKDMELLGGMFTVVDQKLFGMSHPYGGWGFLASGLEKIYSQEGEMTEEEINFMKQAFELNEELVHELNKFKQHSLFSEGKLGDLLNWYTLASQELYFNTF